MRETRNNAWIIFLRSLLVYHKEITFLLCVERICQQEKGRDYNSFGFTQGK